MNLIFVLFVMILLLVNEVQEHSCPYNRYPKNFKSSLQYKKYITLCENKGVYLFLKRKINDIFILFRVKCVVRR